MRRAFAACMLFLVLVVAAAVHFGMRSSPPDAPPPSPPNDAQPGVADAPTDAHALVPDAAPPPKKRPAKPTRPVPKPTRPVPKPTPVTPAPVIPTPVIPSPVKPPPVGPGCTHAPNPAGCPAKEPNVNRPCDAEGVHCVYGAGCCPPLYVCHDGAFEAWFTRCP